MKKKILSILILIVLLLNSSVLLVISEAASTISDQINSEEEQKIAETIIELASKKYINFDTTTPDSDTGSKGLLIEANVKTGIKYSEGEQYGPIKKSVTIVQAPEINGLKPERAEVIVKSTQATNGGKSANYEYNSSTGSLKITAENNPGEDGNIYSEYVENARDEYEIIFIYDSDTYKEVRGETEKYRLELLHTWDKIKKDLNKNLKEILRFDIKLYHVLVVDKKLDIIGMKIPKSRRVNTITWGNRKDSDNYTLAIINIIEHIVRKELATYKSEYKDIVDAIIELAIDNELVSRTLKKSVYLRGDSSLKYLKRQLYPYFLMYLGYSKEEILNRMMEDKIIFELDKYTFERGLATVDLKTFINFCIKNQKHILKIKELEII